MQKHKSRLFNQDYLLRYKTIFMPYIGRYSFSLALCFLFCTVINPEKAHSQTINIDQTFDDSKLLNMTLLKSVAHNNADGIRQIKIGDYALFYVNRKDTCIDEGCVTVITRNINQKLLEISVISNGRFHISDNYFSNIGNGPLFTLYQNGSRTIDVKFSEKYYVIQ